VRVRRHTGGGAPSTRLLAVSAVVCLAVVGAVAFALLQPAESGSGPEPKGVKASAGRDTANVSGAAAEGRPGRPERRPARRRRPAPAPAQDVAAPVVPEALEAPAPAPAPAPPAASPPTADEAQPVEGDDTPARPDFDLDGAPGAPGRGVPEEDRQLEAPPAAPAPAPDEPPAPPAGEPLPAEPGATEAPEAPPAPAPEQPAAP
jgi:hypothetical protein